MNKCPVNLSIFVRLVSQLLSLFKIAWPAPFLPNSEFSTFLFLFYTIFFQTRNWNFYHKVCFFLLRYCMYVYNYFCRMSEGLWFFIAKSVSVIYVLFFKGRNWIFALTKAKLQNVCFSAPYTPCIDNTWNIVTFQFIFYRCMKECFIKTVELRTCWGEITIKDDTEDSLQGTKSINKILKSWESLP